MGNLLTILADRLEAGQSVVEAEVLGHGGSAPRTTGAGMLVFEDGATAGTVGGGALEAEVLGAALELFPQGPGAAAFLSFDLSNDQAALTDMICGGRQDVFVQLLAPDGGSADLYRRAGEELGQGRRVAVLHDLGDEPVPPEGPVRVHGRRLLGPEGAGEMPAGLAEAANLAGAKGGTGRFSHAGRHYLLLAHARPGTVVLLGAGHVARETALAAKRAGFLVTVADDREEFANRERFPQADRLAVLPSFADLDPEKLEIDEDSYLVIVTRGHVHDKDVLGKALGCPAAYIGMIGSSRKQEAIYSALRREGADPAALARVHCPIGLAIGAETPEEIAVSIVAELIRARALRRGTRKRV